MPMQLIAANNNNNNYNNKKATKTKHQYETNYMRQNETRSFKKQHHKYSLAQIYINAFYIDDCLCVQPI
jgi:hypothetical protein